MENMIFKLVLFVLAISITGALGKDGRIVGGENTDTATYPFMASFRYLSTNLVFCGGSIVSNRHIVTAAHCLIQRRDDLSNVRIYTGITSSTSTAGSVHEIQNVIYHPGFTGEKSERGVNHHDIAVVWVKRPITLNRLQNVIELPTRDAAVNDIGYVLGWGSTTYPDDTYPSQLQRSLMRVFPTTLCFFLFDFPMHDSQICAHKRQGVGVCVGDSGGPLVIEGKLAGVVAYNLPCALGIPDMYTNVYVYVDFIKGIISPSRSS